MAITKTVPYRQPFTDSTGATSKEWVRFLSQTNDDALLFAIMMMASIPGMGGMVNITFTLGAPDNSVNSLQTVPVGVDFTCHVVAPCDFDIAVLTGNVKRYVNPGDGTLTMQLDGSEDEGLTWFRVGRLTYSEGSTAQFSTTDTDVTSIAQGTRFKASLIEGSAQTAVGIIGQLMGNQTAEVRSA